jgi:Uma2 family endonuclease
VVVHENFESFSGMALDEFIRLYEEQPFEILDGERTLIMPTVAGHNHTARAIFRALDAYALSNDLGDVSTEMPFVLTDSPDWVKGSRVPDVMFIAKNRLDTYKQKTPDWDTKPFILVPDLVVEVVSPNDSFTKINRKIVNYLNDGVRLIWIVDPQQRNITVHMQDLAIRMVSEEGALDGFDVLPGFSLAVSDIFSK